MNNGRERCASHALGGDGEIWGLTTADLVAVANGHHFHRGWHIGWTWSNDPENEYIDILSEHRLTDMTARRIFPDGAERYLETPHGFRLAGGTPEEDRRLERECLDHNSHAYAALRESGLLPAFGTNLGSQDMNEFLSNGDESRD